MRRFLPAEMLAPGEATGPVHALRGRAAGLRPEIRDPDRVEAARVATLDLLRSAGASGPQGDILEAQALMLDDPSLMDRVQELVPQDGAVPAITKASREAAEALAALDDPYLRERSQDVLDAAALWIQTLEGSELPFPTSGSIVVVEDLPVAWLLRAAPTLLGAAVLRGGQTGHAAIVCRNLGIPLLRLTTAEDFQEVLQAGRIRLEGGAGRVDLKPPRSSLSRPRETGDIHRGPVEFLGVPVQVRANAASVEEVRAALRFGADGIGLLRTELAFEAAGRVLNEDEQFDLYREVASAMDGEPVTVRLLDLGADKPLGGLTLPAEPNPQLGVRGIRLLRRHPQLLQNQLRALFRAAAQAALEVMVPMVATVEDWTFALEAVRATRDSLTDARIPHRVPPLGIMLEVPSALMQVDAFMDGGVDFFSIGTNDLAQYLYASDRQSEDLTIPAVPLALFRLLDRALVPARERNFPVAACGEMASDPLLAPLLVMIGARELSVAGGRIGALRRHLGQLSSASWVGPARRLLAESRDDAAFEAGIRPLLGAPSPS